MKATKKETEDKKKEYRKIEIDNKKKILDKIVETLAEYGIVENHYSALGFKELADDKMRHLMKLTIADGDTSIHQLFFGDCKQTPEELHKENLAYWDKLIEHAEHKIQKLPIEIRKKIIMDGLKNRKQWDYYWDKCSELIAKQDKKKPKAKK